MNCPQRSRLRVPTSQSSAPPDPQSQSTAPPPPGPQPRPARPLSTTCNAHSNPSTPLQLLPQAPAVSPWTTQTALPPASPSTPLKPSHGLPRLRTEPSPARQTSPGWSLPPLLLTPAPRVHATVCVTGGGAWHLLRLDPPSLVSSPDLPDATLQSGPNSSSPLSCHPAKDLNISSYALYSCSCALVYVSVPSSRLAPRTGTTSTSPRLAGCLAHRDTACELNEVVDT